MPVMTTVQGDVPADVLALVARNQCEALFHRFSACIDGGRATEAIDLFADEAVLEIGGRELRGREAILGFLEARQARADRVTRHVGGNFVFDQFDDETATASAVIVVYAGQAGHGPGTVPEFISDCELAFARHPSAGWQVTMRRHNRFAEAQ